jgi:hypothetical protein
VSHLVRERLNRTDGLLDKLAIPGYSSRAFPQRRISAMTQQNPRNKPAQPKGELDEAQLAAVTGGGDAAAPTTTATQSNLQKKISDTAAGITQNIK